MLVCGLFFQTGETIGKAVSDAINLAIFLENQMNFEVLTKYGPRVATWLDRYLGDCGCCCEQGRRWRSTVAARLYVVARRSILCQLYGLVAWGAPAHAASWHNLSWRDLLLQWQAMSHYGIGRSVERVTKYAHASSNEEVRQWAGEYRAAMIELVHAVTQLHKFHHVQQVSL
jgi:hypothetical protein